MQKTPFAGLTQLDPSDPLSEDGFSFQSLNPKIIDALLRLAVVAHRHDAHAALGNPALDPTLGVLNVGGHIPADTSITVGYTLIDADGGETALNATPQLITTQAGLATPTDGPVLALDHAAGTLLAGSYTYAITVTDGAGGETALGPTRTLVIPTGNAVNEIVISGLVALVTGAGGTGWRLWRSINGGTWAVINDGVTDTVTDDGSLCADASQVPPDTTVGNTNATSRLQVTVPGPQDAAAITFRIYGSLDGTFSSPALLGEYPVADLGAVKTYDDLNFLDGSPPSVSLAKQGASQINAETDISNLTWRGPVADAAALPTVGNGDADVRITLDDHALYVWDEGTATWTLAGGTGAEPVAGDVTGTLGATTVTKIRGKNVPLPAAGQDGKGFVYDNASGAMVWTDLATQAELDAHAAVASGVHGLTTAVLSADVGPISSDTTPHNITGLGLAIGASPTERWLAEWWLVVAGTAAMDLKLTLAVPAGCTVLWGPETGGTSSTNAATAGWGSGTSTGNTPPLLGNAAAAISIGLNGGTGGVKVSAVILGGGTAGSVQLQYAQSTSTAANLSILAMSCLVARRLRT